MNSQSAERTCALSVRNVGAYYWRRGSYLRRDRFWALKDISFDLYNGESLGIIGRNGAGKSTLLKLLTGIIKPDRGSIINNGYRTALLTLQIGFVPYLTGRENALLSGMLLGLHKEEIREQMVEISEFSELGEFFDLPISTYSSGMKARLGFSVAFQLNPDIFLIDEVLGVGDTEFRNKSTAVMRERIRSNKTIVLVSHNAATISQLCDRAVWIDEGISQLEGDTETVLRAYKSFLKDHQHSLPNEKLRK